MNTTMKKYNIVILISGGGGLMHTTIKESQKENARFNVKAVVASSECNGLKIASQYKIPTHIINFKNKNEWDNASTELWALLKEFQDIDYVFMLGWLMKLNIPKNWDRKVLNIHPSLLPSFGGQGMYGHKVHQKVKESGTKETGFTIHFADNNYDSGEILFQKSLPILETDTANDIQQKVIDSQHLYIGEFLNSFVEEKLKTTGQIK